MDFSMGYSPDQEAFRIATRTWLAEHAPTGLKVPPDGGPLNAETQEIVKAFRRLLGEKGWLAPSWPKEVGGGGLSRAFDLIIMQEMRELELPSMGDNTRWIPAMMVWGSEAQKERFVVPCLRGLTITWQAFNEPDSGSDFATVHTRAVPEEGGWRINGSKAFITGRFDPDTMVTLAVTDPDRPRRMNLGVFLVDANLPGIEIKTMRMLMVGARVFGKN